MKSKEEMIIETARLVDPHNITDYELSLPRLQERLLFWIAAANNDAHTAAKGLYRFLITIDGYERPFETIKKQNMQRLSELLRTSGIGKYTRKARAFHEAATCGLDLYDCSVDELETIYGVGMKTARCFVMHSRKDANVAALDTHIKKGLRKLGHPVPSGTLGRNEYLKWEKVLQGYMKQTGMSAAENDLAWWRAYKKGLAPTKSQLLDKEWLRKQLKVVRDKNN